MNAPVASLDHKSSAAKATARARLDSWGQALQLIPHACGCASKENRGESTERSAAPCARHEARASAERNVLTMQQAQNRLAAMIAASAILSPTGTRARGIMASTEGRIWLPACSVAVDWGVRGSGVCVCVCA